MAGRRFFYSLRLVGVLVGNSCAMQLKIDEKNKYDLGVNGWWDRRF